MPKNRVGADVSGVASRYPTMSSTETVPTPNAICTELREQTLQACRVARIAAGIVAEGIATGVPSLSDGVREREKELDNLDRLIDQGVTSIITKVDEEHARELLACMFLVHLGDDRSYALIDEAIESVELFLAFADPVRQRRYAGGDSLGNN